ncbi:MAG: Uma2 family endonuclease, partial [Chloroflexaceae bacterium]|nr:Uma2 family endonuclease [Chloroflexaceae bacterium]
MVANPHFWTIHDLETLPDDGGWKRYEIIDGELFVTRAPHINHQWAASKLNTRLETWSEKTGLGITIATPGLIFTATDAVIPDLIWISRDRLTNGVDAAGHLIVAPELIVEILS